MSKKIEFNGMMLSQFEANVADYIFEYKLKCHCYPYLYQLAEWLSTKDRSVSKAIKKVFPGYPDKYMVTTRDRELFLMFEEGMTVFDLAKKAGISYDNVMNHFDGIEKQGVRFKRIVKAKIKPCNLKRNSKDEERVVGVKITSGQYGGKYGYIDEDCLVVIHVDGIEKRLELFPSEYVELNKKKLGKI